MSFGQGRKVEMLDHDALHHIWRKPNTAYQHTHLIPAVRHSSGRVMIWACFIATGPRLYTKVFLRQCEAICLTAKVLPKLGHVTG